MMISSNVEVVQDGLVTVANTRGGVVSSSSNIQVDEASLQARRAAYLAQRKSEHDYRESGKALSEALRIDLPQCYLCAKKHIVRAQILFEEYHTGYPSHIKNLIESMQIAQSEVQKAFLTWQKIMGHMDMGAGELLGNQATGKVSPQSHIGLANMIRDERIKLSDNPLYVPDFNRILVEIHTLQQQVASE